uniref:Molybdopterin synthase catalytic subunit n=1 Tax=Steinernema glaseri TaxID=37863 RepID=A0A1I7YTR2_9BILA
MASELGRSRRLVGIAGCTNAGKTTLSRILKEMVESDGKSITVICQDDFFRPVAEVEKVPKEGDPSAFFYDYDAPSAVDEVGFKAAVEGATSDVVVVEGNMLTEFPEILEQLHRLLFLTLPLEVCRKRRATRVDYDPPDKPGFFEQIVWPAYEAHLKHTVALAECDPRVTFLDGSKELVSKEWLRRTVLNFPEDLVRIQAAPLSSEEAVAFVSSSSCGATSVFIGTTRNSFHGKRVVKLEYECYEPMAYRELHSLCAKMRERFGSIERMAVFHRIGEVPVGEASVVIAASSAHRKEAIAAVEAAIDELKRSVPIWKKEIYGDGSCSWKENPESRSDANGGCCC